MRFIRVDPIVPRLVCWVCELKEWETFKTQTVQIKGHLLEMIRGYICGCAVCTILAEIKAVFPILPLTDNTFNDFSSYPPPITAQNLFPALPLFSPLVLFENFFFPLASALFFLVLSCPFRVPPLRSSLFLSLQVTFHLSFLPLSELRNAADPAAWTNDPDSPSLPLYLSLFQPAKLPKVKQKGRTLFLKYIKFDLKWTRR